ncbi:MAG TPA: rhodanese-like domain-containing protein [Bryobacteraceae bacterium]|nr:rhodanese-like domain-containing protein [Bryobacteraceae bacterium]
MKHTPGFIAIVEDARSRVTEISAEEYRALRSLGTPHTLLDVREESEWRAGHAEGASHLGKGVIERDIETKHPETGELLVLYCGGGYRSALAADTLQKMGYKNVRSLAGGWRAWQEAKLPVSTE